MRRVRSSMASARRWASCAATSSTACVATTARAARRCSRSWTTSPLAGHGGLSGRAHRRPAAHHGQRARHPGAHPWRHPRPRSASASCRRPCASSRRVCPDVSPSRETRTARRAMASCPGRASPEPLRPRARRPRGVARSVHRPGQPHLAHPRSEEFPARPQRVARMMHSEPPADRIVGQDRTSVRRPGGRECPSSVDHSHRSARCISSRGTAGLDCSRRRSTVPMP